MSGLLSHLRRTNSRGPIRSPLVSTDRSVPKSILFAFAGALALIGGILAATWFNMPKTVRVASGTLLEQPRTLPDFVLTDQDGQPFTRAQLQGRWTLVFPGFTYCPDVCPTTLALLKTVKAQLDPAAAERLQVVLFSVDPGRDTPARLKEYVSYFDPDFRAATAPEPQLKAMAQALGVAYARVPGETPESYTMDHSAALILIDPDGALAGYFTPPLQVTALVTDLGQLLGSR